MLNGKKNKSGMDARQTHVSFSESFLILCIYRTVVGTNCDYKALFNVTFSLHSPPPLIFNHDHKGSQEGGSIRWHWYHETYIIRWVMEFITGGTHLDLSKIIYDIIQIQIGVGKIIFTVHNWLWIWGCHQLSKHKLIILVVESC